MVNKRWAQYAAQQYRQQLINYQTQTDMNLSPIKQHFSTGSTMDKAAQFLARQGYKKRGCCK